MTRTHTRPERTGRAGRGRRAERSEAAGRPEAGAEREPQAGPDGTGLSLCHNGPHPPTLPETVPGWEEIRDSSVGFRGRDAVEVAAAFWPTVAQPTGQEQTFHGLGTVEDGPAFDRCVQVAPGMVRMRVFDPRSKDPATSLLDEPDWRQGLLDFLNGDDDPDDEDDDCPTAAGVVRTFSRASRRNLGRAIASIDWADVIHPGDRMALLTLTYPGDWREWCPNPKRVYEHLHALAKRFLRATGRHFSIVWKREFQRRGAPHFHALGPMPAIVAGRPIREWLADAWYEIVGSGDERHRRAGTAVDWSEGLRMADANRAAAYFTGYSAGKADGKAYQDEAPDGWCNDNGSVGRWWGTMGVDATIAEARITERDLIEAKRILRGVLGAQKRTRSVSVRRVDRATGEITYRAARRRYRLSSLTGGAKSGFTFLTNDGPALAIALARALEPDREPWPPGERRPLP